MFNMSLYDGFSDRAETKEASFDAEGALEALVGLCAIGLIDPDQIPEILENAGWISSSPQD